MKLCAIIFCCFSFMYSNNRIHRCGLDFSDPNRNYSPPICSDYIDSENGFFRIHYGWCDSDTESSFFSSYVSASNFYLNEVAQAAEYSRALLLEMGFNSNNNDADGIYDIYLSNRTSGSYGVNFPSIEGGSFIIIDNDFANFSCNAIDCYDNSSSIELMKVTVAHEFFHAVQRTYASNLTNQYFWELSSTWFEDVAYPDINDYLNWVDDYSDDYLSNPEKDISTNQWYNGYSLALFGHYLTQIYDQEDNQNSDIMRLIWENFNNYNGNGIDKALLAIHNVLETYYNSSFSKAWSDFNVRNIFNSEFENMNNNIYYYEDQKFIPPIYGFGNTQYFNNSGTVSNIITESGEVEIIPYQLNDFNLSLLSLNLNEEDCGTNAGGISAFDGYLGIKSNNNNWHRIYNLNSLYDFNQTIALSPGDNLFYVLSSKEVNYNFEYCLNIPYNLDHDDNFQIGDLNLDNVLDVLDLTLLINIILEQVDISEFQFGLVDFNNDLNLNIIDAVTLINIILDS